MKILYVTTISNTVNAFLIPHIRMLINEGYKVDVAFNVEQDVKPEIVALGCRVYVVPFQRTPLKKDNFKAYKSLKNIIVKERYDMVHTHTPVASVIVRLVCRNLKNVRVFYTAHGFHFFKGAPWINWLIYYPLEHWLSRYTDTLITINKEDYKRAKKLFKAKRIKYIPGVGIDIERFTNIKQNKNLNRYKLGLAENAYVILSVGELNKNKNHEIIIKALAKIKNPQIHYLICGDGLLKDYLMNIAFELGVDCNIHFLGFRNDVEEMYKISNLFVFPSYREGLPVSVMEAMASGLPIVCSSIRGNLDLVDNGRGGYAVNATDVDGFVKAILHLKNDTEISKMFGVYNSRKSQKYDIEALNYELLHAIST